MCEAQDCLEALVRDESVSLCVHDSILFFSSPSTLGQCEWKSALSVQPGRTEEGNEHELWGLAALQSDGEAPLILFESIFDDFCHAATPSQINTSAPLRCFVCVVGRRMGRFRFSWGLIGPNPTADISQSFP